MLVLSLSAALVFGGLVHLELFVTHGATVFSLLSLAAGLAQLTLAIGVLRRPSTIACTAALVLSLTLVDLYTLNVTTGLPPLIAHAHHAGTHTVLGMTLALPNEATAADLLTQAVELVGAACAALLLAAPRRGGS